MEYKYCQATGQKVAEEVCRSKLENGTCEMKRDLCVPVGKRPQVSEKERKRRSEAMKKMNEERARVKEAIPDIGDTDVQTEGEQTE